jgi:hypothetical protein
MFFYQIPSQEGSFSDAQPTQIAAGITRDEARVFPRSPYAERLRFGADRPRLPGRRVNCLSRALSLKLKRVLARRRCVSS